MTPSNITCYRYQPLGVWSTADPSWSQCGLLDHYQCVPCGSNRNACGTATWRASPILLTVVQDVVTTAWNDLGHWLRSSQHWQKTRVSPTCKFQGNFFWCRTANKNVTLFKLPYKPIHNFFIFFLLNPNRFWSRNLPRRIKKTGVEHTWMGLKIGYLPKIAVS